MDILDKIVRTKRQVIAQARAAVSESELEAQLDQLSAPRDFAGALRRHPDRVQVIAEVKKASPSAGVIRPDFDALAIARTYERHGAAAISVLTDEAYFQGSLSHLATVRDAVDLPVLRKDFILDRYQLLEARVHGADAVLLIAEILNDKELKHLLMVTRQLGMEALIELYEPDNLQRVIDAGASVIGINNRNLRTFETRIEHTLLLAEHVPDHCCLVSESGIRSAADIERLRSAGVDAVLVGESLVRSPDIGAKFNELLGASLGKQ